jgi:succinyl-CoA synthetase beta subunit
MNIHEYQGKSILKSFGVAVQEGIVAETPEQAVEAAKEMKAKYNSDWVVIKAQIHAGGRGKGGGVKLAKNLDEVKQRATDIIGMQLITPQTSAEGKLVNKVLVAQDVYYPGESPTKEFYMSILLNRSTGRNIIMYSTEGGMDIEQVAEATPHLIWKEEIDPKVGLRDFQCRKVAFNLGLSGNAFKEMTKFVAALYKAYDSIDSSMFEINPVLKNI